MEVTRDKSLPPPPSKAGFYSCQFLFEEKNTAVPLLSCVFITLLSGSMKTPLSPAQLMENSPPYFPVTELKDGMADISTQERKKLLYSLCEVCNIQLNSAAQVQTHYNGKSHLRRVKQLNSTESEPAMSSGSGGPNPHPTTIKSSSTGEAVYLFYLNLPH
ncbi:zinc finger protein 385B isoform X1 [Silurus meridionalis]|nr:zinc finger protein 385B isoform X1 [Silurus meridionalis]